VAVAVAGEEDDIPGRPSLRRREANQRVREIIECDSAATKLISDDLKIGHGRKVLR